MKMQKKALGWLFAQEWTPGNEEAATIIGEGSKTTTAGRDLGYLQVRTTKGAEFMLSMMANLDACIDAWGVDSESWKGKEIILSVDEATKRFRVRPKDASVS